MSSTPTAAANLSSASSSSSSSLAAASSSCSKFKRTGVDNSGGSGSASAAVSSPPPLSLLAVAPEDARTGNEELDRRVENVLAKLLFFNKIKPQTKIEVSSLHLCNNTYYTSLRRQFISRENRNDTYKLLHDTFDEAFRVITILRGYSNNYANELITLLFCNIRNAISTLPILADTYKDDANFVSRIETLGNIYTTKLRDMSS